VEAQVPELMNGAVPFGSVTFSPDGKLMSAAAGGVLYLLDAFNGAVVSRFSTGAPGDGSGCEASFSPDGMYVSSGEDCTATNDRKTFVKQCLLSSKFEHHTSLVDPGCDDRAVRVWSTATGQEVAALQGHAGVPSVLKWAPRRLLLASACNALTMWVPNVAA